MPTINTQDFPTVVRNSVAAIQSTCKTILDFTIGSVVRALMEANATLYMWLQGAVLQVLANTRAATSSGSDLDSWMADFSFARLAAVAATGTATFSRFSTTQQALVLVGTVLETADGSQTFKVTADTGNANYNATLGGYTILAGNSSIDVPVQAVTAGAGGNIAANTLTVLQGAIPGVDTVNNAAAYTNGVDAETDSAYRTRFQSYLAGLSKATRAAVGNAVTSLQQGMVYTLVENQNYDGSTHDGYFYVVFDDGSGTPSDTLKSSVYNAIDAVRPIGTPFDVFKPVKETANVAMTLTVATGYVKSDVEGLVTTALTNYINALPLGGTLSYSRLSQVAYDASPGITDVSGVTLNGGTSNLVATNQQVIKTGTITLS